MKSKREFYLPGFEYLSKTGSETRFGGELSVGKRKKARPIDPKQALHVVLRSSKARGQLSLLHPKHCNALDAFVRKTARRWGVKLYRFANVGNHLHLLIQVPNREVWKRFSKELSGGIVQIVTAARKGAPIAREKGVDLPESAQRAFWDHLVFTRIVKFGRDFDGLGRYIVKNLFEASGLPLKRLLGRGLKVILVMQDGSVLGAPS